MKSVILISFILLCCIAIVGCTTQTPHINGSSNSPTIDDPLTPYEKMLDDVNNSIPKTPTPTPTSSIKYITFTAMYTEENGYTVTTTDNKILVLPTFDSWVHIMPNKIYKAKLEKVVDNKTYLISNCELYPYQNPSYITYPNDDVNHYEYYGNTNFYESNDTYYICDTVCIKFIPDQKPPSMHVLQQFPPIVIIE